MSVLIIGTSSYAGMGPYVCEIINSFSSNDPVYFFLVEDERKYYTENIKTSLLNKCLIIKRENNKVNKIKSFIMPSHFLKKRLMKQCEIWGIQTIHSLSDNSEFLWKVLLEAKHTHRVIFTVHDLEMHEAKKSIHKQFRQWLMYKRSMIVLKSMNVLVTNSIYQYNDLIQSYPQKQIFFHEFPSLVTDVIKKGTSIPDELKGESNYILFFGRIEYYKGVDLLYNAYWKEREIYSNFKLVIAGGGDVYFSRKENEEERVIWLNRYIQDKEVAYLFKNAKCVVFPYISVTQSGVLSISCHFQTPVITSDIPFFRSMVAEGLGVTFEKENLEDLVDKLKFICCRDNSDIKNKQIEYYSQYFSKERIREKLLTIYKSN